MGTEAISSCRCVAKNPELVEKVVEQWKSFEIDGCTGFRCKEKLKRLKQWLREWNKKEFSDVNFFVKEVA